MSGSATSAHSRAADGTETDSELRAARGHERRMSRLELAVSLAIVVTTILWTAGDTLHEEYLILGCIYATLGLALYVPLLLGGVFSLAFSAYFGVGAYSVALLTTKTSVGPGLAILVGVVVAMVFAVIVDLSTWRLTGLTLGLATLLITFTFETWVSSSHEFTGGASGLGGIERLAPFGAELGRTELVVTWIVFVWLVGMAASRFRRSLPGMALRLQRDVRPAADAVGLATRRLQMSVHAVGAAVAAVGGSLMAMINQFVQAELFGVDLLFLVLFMPVIGGLGTPWGVVVGAGVVLLIFVLTGSVGGIGVIVFAVGTIIVLVLLPAGLLPSLPPAYRRVVTRWSGESS